MLYWTSANTLLRAFYPSRHWKIQTNEKKIYLTFDDGPHPTITPFVLDRLQQYNAKATFFCIGKNAREYPDVYARILSSGHVTGNHTMNHRNGWKTDSREYFDDIKEAAKYIDSKLFRPPYGRMTQFQSKALQDTGWEIIMWTILTGDFDKSRTPESCWKSVEKSVQPGSIVLFHDSEKAWDRLAYVLPRTLERFSSAGYTFETISMDILGKHRNK
jgi:peptidoglycan/xylan/chitin deacetylase (PgdA/CDA1 family)